VLGGHSRRNLIGAAALALLAALTVSLGTAGATPTRLQAPSKVSVVLKEWKLIPSSARIKAGKVTFLVKNDGALAHEFVVLRTDAHHHALAVKGGEAVETGLKGEIVKIVPGQKRSLTLSLKPGKYVLLCNLLGHYRAGQFAALRVS